MRIAVAVAFVVVPLVTAARGDARRMGYCFDAAFHEKTGRLFVAAGDVGTHVLAVTDGKLSFVATVADGGYHRNLKVSGDRLYLADAERGLAVFDITAQVPICTWRQQDAHGMGLDVRGNRVYLAAGGDGLCIFDISTPDSPKRIGACKTNADAWDVWINERYAYVAELQKGLTVVDVSQPDQPRKVSCVTWEEQEPMAEIVRGEGPIVCVAAGKHGLVVVDVGDPEKPKVVSRYKSGQEGFGEGLCIRDGLIYLANGNENNRDENGLIIVDARNPQALRVRGKCLFTDWVEGVCLAGHQAFVANTRAGVRAIDVSDPNHPSLTDSFGRTPEKGPAAMVNGVGWGRQSNQQIAAEYDKAWLDQISDVGTWLKIGFALYDAKRYDDALTAFEKMATLDEAGQDDRATAVIWQGHMLDLLGKREEAVARYRRVADMGLDSGVRHDQFGLAYEYTPYAKERMTMPFVRVENRWQD